MPIYEYACVSCGSQEERLERMDAPEARECPSCRVQGAMRRRVSRTAFVLSGGGWYASGYGSEASSAADKAPGPDTAGSAPAGSAPAGSAPAEPSLATTAPASACSGGCACHAPAAPALVADNT